MILMLIFLGVLFVFSPNASSFQVASTPMSDIYKHSNNVIIVKIGHKVDEVYIDEFPCGMTYQAKVIKVLRGFNLHENSHLDFSGYIPPIDGKECLLFLVNNDNIYYQEPYPLDVVENRDRPEITEELINIRNKCRQRLPWPRLINPFVGLYPIENTTAFGPDEPAVLLDTRFTSIPELEQLPVEGNSLLGPVYVRLSDLTTYFQTIDRKGSESSNDGVR